MPKDLYQGVKVAENFDKKLVKEAFLFAQKAHEGQKRKSGEEYINHPLAVAKILVGLGMDAKIVAAGLLHDTMEDSDVSAEELKEKFGTDVAMLVQGVTNLGQIDFSTYSTQEEAEAAQLNLKNENLRKLFLAMSEDMRVVVIKLADRLHNMQTIKYLAKKDQIRIARETLNIFAPLALRLGMGEIKGKLEDLSFPIAYPAEYTQLKKEANRRYKAADRYVLHLKRLISDVLKNEGIEAQIEGRSKHLYSLFRKINRPEIAGDFNKIYDLVALRIITETVPDCYRILGSIHALYRPLPNYIRDYIAAPKPNGYRSIHTSVFGPEGKIVEIQIRTKAMHEEAEFGVASHLHYNEQKSAGASDEKLSKGTFAKSSQTDFLKRIKEWQSGVADGKEFVEGLKFEFLDDRIYVFSPKGDIFDLTQGATPVDFAYEVHSRIGDSCTGAKVNGKIVPLDFKLKTRDVVEVITQKNSVPKRGWLDFVKTSKAKQHIRAYFRSFDFAKNSEEGAKIVHEELNFLGISVEKISAAELKDALSESSFKKIEDLYASVGAGLTTPRQAIKIITGRSYIAEPKEKAVKVKKTAHKADFKGMKINIASCCNPKKGDQVVTYVSRGKGIVLHKKNCSNVKGLEKNRIIIHNPWEINLIPASVLITSNNRVGLIRDISTIISESGINIEKIKNAHSGEESKIEVCFKVEDMASLSDLMKKISKVKDVKSVKRI